MHLDELCFSLYSTSTTNTLYRCIAFLEARGAQGIIQVTIGT